MKRDDASRHPERGSDVDSQVDLHGHETVGSLIHAASIAGLGVVITDQMKAMRAASLRGAGATVATPGRCYTVWMNSGLRFKKPLTRDQLLDIQERRRRDPDVHALLWEVFRLRATQLRMHNFLRQNPGSSTAQAIREAMQADLDEEPVVKERPTL